MRASGIREKGLKLPLNDIASPRNQNSSTKNSGSKPKNPTEHSISSSKTFLDQIGQNTYYLKSGSTLFKDDLNPITEESTIMKNPLSYSKDSTQVKNTLETGIFTDPTPRAGGLTSNSPDKRRPYVDPDSLESRFIMKTQMTLPVLKTLSFDNDDDYDDPMQRPYLLTTQASLTKFRKSITAINTCEKRKLMLSKEVFFSKDHLEILKNFKKEFTTKQTNEPSQIRTLRENKKEVIDLLPMSKVNFKIDCLHKKFPLNVKITVISGTFEIFVSQNNPNPDSDNYDLYFHTESFMIDFKKDMDHLYLAVTTKGRLKATILINFTEEEQEKQKTDYTAHLREWQAKREKAKKKAHKIYELYHEDMTIDQKLEMQLVIGKYSESIEL